MIIRSILHFGAIGEKAPAADETLHVSCTSGETVEPIPTLGQFWESV